VFLGKGDLLVETALAWLGKWKDKEESLGDIAREQDHSLLGEEPSTRLLV